MRTRVHAALSLLLLSLAAQSMFAAVSTRERNALIAIYNATGGPSWFNSSNWNGAPGTECTWAGVTCDFPKRAVVGLRLNGNNLSGTMPGVALADLTNLQSINMSGNALTGAIPVELGTLTNLTTLNLRFNQLSGSIPSSLGNLESLNGLFLRSNQLSGPIPPELGSLPNLMNLDLYLNQLTGTIPPQLGSLAKLRNLSLNQNQLSGSIPPELGLLTSLDVLALSSNQLSGSIPAALGNLEHLTSLTLANNQLTGTIPPELGNLSRLSSLALQGNQLNGSIPPELGALSQLTVLNLSLNALTGEIPSQLGNLTRLETLNVSRNQLSGPVPAELGNLTRVYSLAFRSNMLDGELPATLANLTRLVNKAGLSIGFNAFHSANASLLAFLDSKQWGGSVMRTQTLAPEGLTTFSVSATSLDLSWTPVEFQGAGSYRVLFSTTSGGPYTLLTTTPHKLVSSVTVGSLLPGTTYYFVVESRTDPHVYNNNTVTSEPSAEVSVTTLPAPLITSIAPTSGAAAASVVVTITGSGFRPESTVAFGAFDAASVTFVNGTELQATTPLSLSPGTIYPVTVTNPEPLSHTLSDGFMADFNDVPQTHPFHPFVERLVRNGVTAGCGGGNYCPNSSVTRAQMAVFLLVSKYGVGYTPPPATGTIFADVGSNSFAAAFIERLYAEQVTGGCAVAPLRYCPASIVTREQMAVFLLVTKEGAAYVPPAAVGIFDDVPVTSGFARWIEELAARGITGGCAVSPPMYCPTSAVTRGQMAVFLVTTFQLP